MRTRLNPWVVVLTAALTFGSLMAFVGPHSFGRHWRHHKQHGLHGWHEPYDRYNNRNDDRYDGGRRSERHDDQAPVKPDTNAY